MSRLTRAVWLLFVSLNMAGAQPVAAQPVAAQPAAAQPVAPFDFSKPGGAQGWDAAHDIARLESSAEGLVLHIDGADPYATGPARDFPAGTPLWLSVRVRSEQAGGWQIFYFKDAPGEENSVRFEAQAGWQEVRLPLPALGSGSRFRIDPPGTSGQAVVAWMKFEPRLALQEPVWPRPLAFSGAAFSLRAGDLSLAHGRNAWGDFQLSVAGRRMALGFNRPLIGYMLGGQLRWIDLRRAAKTVVRRVRTEIRVSTTLRDRDGARWELEQSFSAARAGTIQVNSRVRVDRDRSMVFVPMLVILPGAGSFGPAKGQAILPGLEYLDNEPSSSQADINGSASQRQVPDSLKITFPLMAIEHDARYIGLVWDKDPKFSAVFDSPDRLFRSNGHVLGVLFPGSDGANRVEGSLLPYQGELLRAKAPLTLNAAIIGGRGRSMVPAIEHYVRLRGLPPRPDIGMKRQDYFSLAARGWLDSKIRQGDLFRHAFWPGFEPHTAADAPLLMEWLARRVHDDRVAARLRATAQAAIKRVEPDNFNNANVSHVTYPVAALVYGHVAENAAGAANQARELLGRFEPDGTVRYRPREGGTNYGKTHFAPTANGLTAQTVASLLDAATFAGDRELIGAALKHLGALDQFAGGVPRGAQTWEVPLHTPDILASAHLVRAYTRGFELTGDAHFLEMARYWAWTGVAFVYLANPTNGRVGPFSTIAVLGASNWQAPVWFGQPVQWCGLVYADALYRLAPHDPNGIWKPLADGITAAGIQHTWSGGDAERAGLLPDFYHLRPQRSDGPAINPGTVQTNAVRLFGEGALYDFHAFRAAGLLVHAPGTINAMQDVAGRASFVVEGWPDRPYYVLINGLKKAPRLRLNGQDALLNAPHQYVAAQGQLILQVTGRVRVEVDAS